LPLPCARTPSARRARPAAALRGARSAARSKLLLLHSSKLLLLHRLRWGRDATAPLPLHAVLPAL
jgi:hypothetical protein